MKRLTAWSALFFCLICWQLSAQAIEQIDIRIGKWSTDQLAAKGFELGLSLSETGVSLTAQAEQLHLAEPFNVVNNVHLSCEQTQWLSGQIHCQTGRLSFSHARLGQQNLTFNLNAEPEKSEYLVAVKGLSLAGAGMTVSAKIKQTSWQVDVDAESLKLEEINSWLALWLDETQLSTLSSWDYQGRIDIQATIQGTESRLHKLKLNWLLPVLNFSNESGTQVAELLQGEGSLSAVIDNNGWQWQSNINLKAGQSYIDPVFIDFKNHPLQLTASGYVSSDFSLIDVPEMRLEQSTLLKADLQFSWREGQLSKLNVQTKPLDLETLYPVLLQPFMLGTAADKLVSSGKLAAHLDWHNNAYQLTLNMDKVSIDDENQRFQINELSGELGWSTTAKTVTSELHWQQAQIYAISLGQTQIKAQSMNNGLSLTQQVNLPILDGSLLINDFSLQQQPDAQLNWTFDGLLTPISMETLSEALQWPTLHGKLSGVIPKVSYRQQQLKIDGALQMKIFDGTTVIRDLRMTSPLGTLPQLYANIDIAELDLELLTRTFDVGRISGKLEGYVHELRLSNWQPVQFEARLATPAIDPGKRRISQKAVDNLTQIGGGAGMLSRSFLRFFDDFSYKKLGLSCTLKNGICEMAGIEEAEQGYYIVKGGGGLPPWINVVGYTRRVDWSELIERLKAVQDSSGPVIQ